jgi:uncharacterized repeat protein (TIGR03803 family)
VCFTAVGILDWVSAVFVLRLSRAAASYVTDNGNFYGTTQYGGANDYGTVFKISHPADTPQDSRDLVTNW